MRASPSSFCCGVVLFCCPVATVLISMLFHIHSTSACPPLLGFCCSYVVVLFCCFVDVVVLCCIPHLPTPPTAGGGAAQLISVLPQSVLCYHSQSLHCLVCMLNNMTYNNSFYLLTQSFPSSFEAQILSIACVVGAITYIGPTAGGQRLTSSHPPARRSLKIDSTDGVPPHLIISYFVSLFDIISGIPDMFNCFLNVTLCKVFQA